MKPNFREMFYGMFWIAVGLAVSSMFKGFVMDLGHITVGIGVGILISGMKG